MKPRLQTSLGQHLVLTPQLRQAIHLLQLSATELGAELAAAVESNPLLDWAEAGEAGPDDAAAPGAEAPAGADGAADEWREPAERMAAPETLRDHLLWQLRLSHLSPRDRRIAEVLIDAIDEDGYLRESLAALREALGPGLAPGEDEVLAVLHQLQRFDPPGV